MTVCCMRAALGRHSHSVSYKYRAERRLQAAGRQIETGTGLMRPLEILRDEQVNLFLL